MKIDDFCWKSETRKSYKILFNDLFKYVLSDYTIIATQGCTTNFEPTFIISNFGSLRSTTKFLYPESVPLWHAIMRIVVAT